MERNKIEFLGLVFRNNECILNIFERKLLGLRGIGDRRGKTWTMIGAGKYDSLKRWQARRQKLLVATKKYETTFLLSIYLHKRKKNYNRPLSSLFL